MFHKPPLPQQTTHVAPSHPAPVPPSHHRIIASTGGEISGAQTRRDMFGSRSTRDALLIAAKGGYRRLQEPLTFDLVRLLNTSYCPPPTAGAFVECNTTTLFSPWLCPRTSTLSHRRAVDSASILKNTMRRQSPMSLCNTLVTFPQSQNTQYPANTHRHPFSFPFQEHCLQSVCSAPHKSTYCHRSLR